MQMQNQQTQIRTLLKALNQQLSLGHKLADCFRALSESIVERNIDRVTALVEESDRLQTEERTAEQMRCVATQALSGTLGLQAGDKPVTLSQLTRYLPAPDGVRLRMVAKRIRDLDSELRGSIERNRLLLQEALEFIEFSLHAITHAALNPAKYGNATATVTTPTFYIDQRA